MEGFWKGLGRVLGSQNLSLEAKKLPSEAGNHPKIDIKLKIKKMKKNEKSGARPVSARRMTP